MRRLVLAGAMTLVALACATADAGTLTFFGEDLGPGAGNGRVASPVNSDAAQTSFLSNLVGVGTEDFESFSNGTTSPLGITFGSVGATLNGSGSINEIAAGATSGAGRYPISGTKYWTTSGDFSIAFTDAVSAFGFYGTDLGDFGGQVTLTLANGGGSKLVNIGNSINVPSNGVSYFGIIETDAADAFTAVTFGNTAFGSDIFGFDDMTIGTFSQVQVVPVPPAAGLGLALMAGLGLFRMRRRKRFDA